ncbi:hypothetical protein COY52_04625 [Candidatus Desantisbacteria bacterium CG_4_10_14_0_8_um_filter_48_22]|uniref:FAD-dependent oxidoreductase n=1 Tax=Candidatus Desantisbacteria bacterium CG_4_10_14_0_8_um_filter_48_22 TaxID=1974543 RepID=A0A2M7SD26_9BACT|nr:MAG: hypothetical protein COY52_04625 [Candidatus Desantisbacteria bacterium CG_4_10_14_0_8_um_filter_48_22]
MFYTEPAKKIKVAENVDTVVVGGGPAGIGAALSAARNGAETLIVEHFGCLGGIATSGVHTHLNQMNSEGVDDIIVGGIPLELCRRVENKGIGKFKNGMLDFELEGMKRELDNMMEEAKVKILYHTPAVDVIKKGNNLEGIIIENKSGRQAIFAKRVIDCTGDADIAFKSGVPFEFGRERDHKTQPCTLMFRVGGCDVGKVEKYRAENKDWGLNAIWKKAIENRDMPPFQTQLMGFWYTHSRPDQIGVNFTNMTGVDATDGYQVSKAMTEGRKQAEITLNVMRKYLPGCENAYMIDTAQMLGVRETRRIKGEYTLTVDEVLSAKKFPETGVAKSAFFVDIHNPEGTGLFNPRHLPKGEHFDIPYGCLVPLKVESLLVAGRCISVTHESLGAVRVMFQCMAMGEAAGAAAVKSIKEKTPLRKLNTPELREMLKKQGVIL